MADATRLNAPCDSAEESTPDLQLGQPTRGPLARGTSVGRYLLLDLLGQGGMGVVYTAYDPDLDRQIALKLLRVEEHAAGTSLRDRLLGEAQAMARLSHPNVIAVHDVGTFGQDVFIAMERVEGKTLRHWLQAKPRTRREILEAFLAAGEGLAAAHRAGLVHRDFKPDNVMIGLGARPKDGAASTDDGRVRVLDFGVAQGIRSEAGGSEIVGTPRFMAPEQHRGAAVDARADQFTFCLCLYTALCDASPFSGDTLERHIENVVAGRLAEPPSASRLPRALRQALLRGLLPNPDDRHPSMAALLALLRADPYAAHRRWLRAGSMVVLAAGAAFVWRTLHLQQNRVCAGAERKLVGVWDDARRSAMRSAFRASGKPYAEAVLRTVERTFDDYTRSWVGMHVDACEATQVRREQSQELLDLRMTCLDDRLMQLQKLAELYTKADGGVIERAAQSAQSLPSLDRCADQAALRAPMPPPVDPGTRRRVDEVRAQLAQAGAFELAGKYNEGIALASAAVASAEVLKYRPIEAEAQLRLGQLQDQRGEFKAGAASLNRAFIAAMAGRHDEAGAAAAISLIHAAGAGLEHFAEADGWAEIALASVERLKRKDDLLGMLYRFRAGLSRIEGKFDDALVDAQRAVEMELRALGPDHHRVALAYRSLGSSYYKKAKYTEALACYQRAAAIIERTLGPDHPALPPILNGMANAYASTGQHERVLAQYQRAIVILQRINADDPDLVVIYNNIGEELEGANRLEEASGYYTRALALGQRARGASLSTVFTQYNLGMVELKLHHPEAALRWFEEALAVAERTIGPTHWEYAKTLGRLAEAHRQMGHLAQALAGFRRAQPIGEKVLGAMHPDLGPLLAGMGQTYVARGDVKRGIPILERVVAIYEAQGGGFAEDLAEGRFALAQALWQSGSRARATELATQAQGALAALGERARASTAEVTTWLARHP